MNSRFPSPKLRPSSHAHLLANADDHYVSARTFNRLIPKDPVTIKKIAAGLLCQLL